MVVAAKSTSLPWLRWVLMGSFLIALGLRLWRIGQFNTLVFDEIYYPVFANRYLIGESVYNSHPPLSQYLIALGMWLGSHLPIGQDTVNGLTGSLRSTFSYRWFNAIAGAGFPVILGAIAFYLSHSRLYGAIAAILALFDGLFLVESRYGLNNIYLVVFGLLGHWCWLRLGHQPPKPRLIRRQVKLQRTYRGVRGGWLRRLSDQVSDRIRYPRSWQPWQWWSLAGICWGCAAAVKWNGLGFLGIVYGLWLIAQVQAWWQQRGLFSKPTRQFVPFQLLRRLTVWQLLLYCGVIPVATYCVLWIPHLLMNPEPGFIALQHSILNFHAAVGSGQDVHPYCSPWYSWLWMGRPVAYFYATAIAPEQAVPQYPPLPSGTEAVVYDVHAMGNPILWWLSSIAIALFILLIVWPGRQLPERDQGIYLFCLVGFGANLLPWIGVTRCTFLYHYMGAFIFALLALAYWLWQCWLAQQTWQPLHQLSLRLSCLVLWGAIAIAFGFWLPIYLGLPLTPEAYQLRMWFDHWI